MAPGKPTQDGPTLFDAAEPPTPKASAPERPPLLLLMDGHAMVYRAWFALQAARPMTVRKTGEDVRGVYSFTTTFFKTLASLKPTHVAITFDHPGKTFRDDLYDQYKANRPPMPDPLRQNIQRSKEVMQAFDIPIYEVPGYEADDVLGTIAKFADDEALDIIIATGDTDTLQLVSPHVRVLMTSGFGESKLYDVAAVNDRYGGLSPDQVIDVKSLTGDTSDNIPGVPGVGIKTAIKLIQQFDSVEMLLDRVDEITSPRIQGLVRDNADQLRASKVLVTIARDAPADFEFDATRFGTFDRDNVVAIFQELEFSSLVGRIPQTTAESAALDPRGAPEALDTPVTPATPAAPSVEFVPVDADVSVTIVDDDAKLDAMLARLASVDAFVVEAQASSQRPMEAALVGLAFAIPDATYYVPTGHLQAALALSDDEPDQPQGPQLAADAVMAKVAPLMQGLKPGVIGHNLNFSMTLLSNFGVAPTKVPVVFDTYIAAHLLGEKSLGLKQLAFNRLNAEIKGLTDVTGTGRKAIAFDAVSIADAAAFAGANVEATLRLLGVFTSKLERDGLTAFNREYSMPLVGVLVKVQTNGIAIDASVLSDLNEELVVAIDEAEQGAYYEVAHEFAINSPQQLGELLFDELKLRAGKKTKTGYSTDASILENLRDAHPVINHVLEYRALTKLKSTYVDTLPEEVNPRTHRIHTTYNQAGSATGRLASNDPNLQNIPVRTELGLRVRKAFIAERRPGWILLSADYSQIDLRALAHLSQDPALMAAFERDEDIHASTASLIYGVALDEVTHDMRRLAKVMNFGVAYGLSAFGIARQTEMNVDEGGQFIADYFGTYPKVREYLDGIVANAKASGYAETLLGRRRYLPELNSPIYPVRQAGERMALNMPVQGTSSDIINAAMVLVQQRLENEGFEAKMLLQVHDELVFELPRGEEAKLSAMLHETMPNALKLSVPVKIDIKQGENWADMTSQRETPVEAE
jgi:DNA polymerase-1